MANRALRRDASARGFPVNDFNDAMTLGDARGKLRGLARTGARCPCCRQFVKAYRRKLNSGMARAAIRVYRATCPGEYCHLQEVDQTSGSSEGSKLRCWGLLVEERERREDGGRSGWWCLTEEGRRFVTGAHTVPKYALLYDGRLLHLEGAAVSIVDCLGEKFDYHELMNA